MMQETLVAYEKCRLNKLDKALLKGMFTKKPITSAYQMDESDLFFPEKENSRNDELGQNESISKPKELLAGRKRP